MLLEGSGKKFMRQSVNDFPLVSILLPVYNGEAFLERSIQSCLSQTYDNLELIVVDDGSKDNSLQIANEFASFDKRVTIISNQLNKQLPASLNIGHRAARGEIITWTSHDNYFEPNAIEVLLKQMRTSDVDIVYSDVRIIESCGKYRKILKMKDSSLLLFGNSIGASFLYKKEVYLRNDGYNENLHTVEDYDFWLRASIHSTFNHIDEVLYNFRSHQDSLSSKLNISGSVENNIFATRLQECYSNFLQLLKFREKEYFTEILSKIHLYKKINVTVLLQRFSEFTKILQETADKTRILDYGKMVEMLDHRIRFNISEFPENQNAKILWLILLNRPSILLRYDRRNSSRLVWKCLKNR